MSFLNKVRSLFGINADVSDAPLDQLDTIDVEYNNIQGEIKKAQEEFDDIDQTLSLKIAACDKLIEKGSKEGEENKKYLVGRLDRITTTHLEIIKGLIDQSKSLEKQKIDVEGELIVKAIEITARLSDDNQKAIKNIIDVWNETGIIKGEEIDSQARAIMLAIEEIVKGEEPDTKDKKQKKVKKVMDEWKAGTLKTSAGDKVESHDQAIAISLSEAGLSKAGDNPMPISSTGQGETVEYDSPVEGHYANVIVRRTFKEGEKEVSKILFLKRASTKVIEPNKFCLPGGHIDEGETIETAALRELKEEANLDASSAYIIGKAKCEDGKWAFYLSAYPQGEVMLLDGESVNAAWMSQEEWLEADLLFDLKDHLVAIDTCTRKIDDIPNIMKGESEIIVHENDTFTKYEQELIVNEELEKAEIDVENPFYYENEEELIKGKAAQEGEVRVWGGVKYEKSGKKWNKVDLKKKSHSTKQLKEHVENTSSEQLKKVAAKADHPHNDAAKRELERRSSEKDKEDRKSQREDKLRAEDKSEKKADQKLESEKKDAEDKKQKIEDRRVKQNQEEEERKKKLDESLPVGTEVTFEATTGMSSVVKRFSGKVVAHESDDSNNLLYDVRWQEGDKPKRRLVDPKWIISSKEDIKKSEDSFFLTNPILETIEKGKHYEYVKVERDGKVFFQYREVGTNKVEENLPIGESLDTGDLDLKITRYSDKSLLITGNTYDNLELLRKIKADVGLGSWNKTLGGWIFPLSGKEEIMSALIAKMPSGTYQETVEKEQVEKLKNSVDIGTSVTVGGEEVEVSGIEMSGKEVGYDVKDAVVPESEIGIVPVGNSVEVIDNATESNRFKSGKELFGKKEGELPVSDTIEKQGEEKKAIEVKEFTTRSDEKVQALDYTGIKQMDIQLVDQEGILDKPKPNWCSDINLPIFSGRKLDNFVFDYVKLSDDHYMVATNGYEKSSYGTKISSHKITNDQLRNDLISDKYSHFDLEKANIWGNDTVGYEIDINGNKYHYNVADKANWSADRDALFNNHKAEYAIVSIDQIVAMQDYYQKTAKAIIAKKKDDETKKILGRVAEWSEEKVKMYYPFDYDKRLSEKQKKKYTKEEWGALPKEAKLAEIPNMKYPAVQMPAGKRISQLDENTMWKSNFDMYKQFVDKNYKTPFDTGKRTYSHDDPAVIEYKEVRDQLQWRKIDLQVQREENDSSFGKGQETSYGDINTKNDLLESHGVKVKLQNGKDIKEQHIEQIKSALTDVYGSFGDRSNIAKEFGLKISHSGEKLMFARNALGLYVPSMKAIGVSNNQEHNKFGFTLAHEFSHFIDHFVGSKGDRNYASDNVNSTAGKIASVFRSNMNKKTDSSYLNRSCENFARALEEYHAMRIGGEDAIKSQAIGIPYHEMPEHVSKDKFNTLVKPLIEQFLKENEEILKAIMDDLVLV